MSIKIILTQIMKNETKVIERMLNTTLGFIDGIAMVDTGSTDNSIQLVRDWGEIHGVETYIISRPFDNYENSRNAAIDLANKNFLSKNDNHDYFGFWLDADEELCIDGDFDKTKITKDLYQLTTKMGNMVYTRNELYRLSKPFRFYGILHEYLVCSDTTISTGLLNGISVNVNSDGASWTNGSIADKYKKHAALLEDHLDNNSRDPRWVFYTGQSYFDSASLVNNRVENDERLTRAIKYYKERVGIKSGYVEERFYSQFRIGLCMSKLERPWKDTMEEYLKAYSLDSNRAEPLKEIIEYYVSVKEWNLAYIYSKFAKINHHGKSPYPSRVLFVSPDLYAWKLLEYHSVVCYYSNRKEESKSVYKDLMNILKESPQLFSMEDRLKITANAKYFL